MVNEWNNRILRQLNRSKQLANAPRGAYGRRYGKKTTGGRLNTTRPVNQIISNIAPTYPGLNILPRDSDAYFHQFSVSHVHGAYPDTMGTKIFYDLMDLVVIGDDETRVYDNVRLKVNFVGRTDGYVQTLHFFSIVGPSTSSFTGANYTIVTSGIRAAIEASASGGAKVTHLESQVITPRMHMNLVPSTDAKQVSWTINRMFEIDLTEVMNNLTIEVEKVKGQGRADPIGILAIACVGEPSGTDYYYNIIEYSWHTRKRKLSI